MSSRAITSLQRPPSTSLFQRSTHYNLSRCDGGSFPLGGANRSMKSQRASIAESVAEKPMFRSAFKSRRCLIPASGFYEWKTVEGQNQPFYITAIDGTVLTIAGLHEVWKAPDGGLLRSCAMIVTAANEFMAPIHDRMPVLLSAHQFASWLSGEAGTEILQ